jgi:hypothetical protein
MKGCQDQSYTKLRFHINLTAKSETREHVIRHGGGLYAVAK